MIGMTNLNDSDPFNRPLTAGELAAYIRERNAATGADEADQHWPMPAEACTEVGSETLRRNRRDGVVAVLIMCASAAVSVAIIRAVYLWLS